MHKIKLVPEKVFYNECGVTVYDVTDGAEKKRCNITVEYSVPDIRRLKEQNMDFEAAMAHYREWIYDVVKHYILDDWQCTEGLEETMSIVAEHIRGHFEEVGK